MKSSQRVVAIVLFLGGLFFMFVIWGAVFSGARGANFVEMMFPIAFSLFAGFFVIRSLRNRVRVSDRAVELHGLSGSRILPIERIKGRRRYFDPGDENSAGVWHVVFESNDDRHPKIDIEEVYNFDVAFYTWFKSLPDLDTIDKSLPKVSNFGLV
jgi:hypothetical protein